MAVHNANENRQPTTHNRQLRGRERGKEPSMEFSGQTAIVTGVARGFGRAIVRRLAKGGEGLERGLHPVRPRKRESDLHKMTTRSCR